MTLEEIKKTADQMADIGRKDPRLLLEKVIIPALQRWVELIEEQKKEVE
jgi:hypothetical protein